MRLVLGLVVASAAATVMSELEVDPCAAAPAQRAAVNAGNVIARVEQGRLPRRQLARHRPAAPAERQWQLVRTVAARGEHRRVSVVSVAES